MDDAKEHPPLGQTGGGLRRKDQKTELLLYPSRMIAVNTALPARATRRLKATANGFD
jgi:hypothetical protein